MKFSYNNALGKSVNETQLQQHESLVTKSTTLEANLNTDVKALDAGLVIIESSGTKSDKHDTSSSSRTYITHAVDADIRPVNDQVPFAKVRQANHACCVKPSLNGNETSTASNYLNLRLIREQRLLSAVVAARILKLSTSANHTAFSCPNTRTYYTKKERQALTLEIPVEDYKESHNAYVACNVLEFASI
ncbi:hypothetical protein Tco_1558659 [Tanacetum coccineum]